MNPLCEHQVPVPKCPLCYPTGKSQRVPEHRRGWTIEVCRTCDRRAAWPFCAHREQPPPTGATSWCVAVDVIPRRPSERTGSVPATPPRGPSGVSAGPDGTR